MAPEEVPRPAAYLALDPGEVTGWALFDEQGEILKFGQFGQGRQTAWLTTNLTENLKAVIIEDYRNYANKRQKNWSRNQTSKNIGAIEMLCEMRSVPYFLQPANIKSIGYKWAGLVEAPSNHAISHQYDAVVHGVYFLRTKGILKPSIPKEN
jgi:hypothetical protein